ncbi:MAG: MerR family transcriptional regulator [Planctomycetes bacterium]|nr:MerR family transcriptional regulator [Planctomycetota bacterium]
MKNDMTISQLAGAAGGVSLRTIRYYEEIGLLTPSGWTKGGQRVYGEGAFVTLKKVRILQESGMKLAEIGEFLMALAARPTAGKERTLAHIAALERFYKALSARRDDIQQLLCSLDEALQKKEKCVGCGASDCGKCGQLAKWSQFGLAPPA